MNGPIGNSKKRTHLRLAITTILPSWKMKSGPFFYKNWRLATHVREVERSNHSRPTIFPYLFELCLSTSDLFWNDNWWNCFH